MTTKYQIIKRLIFFWITSFALATIGYYLLKLLTQDKVFGTWFRMFPYHFNYPIQYIVLPCFFYGILATVYAQKFNNSNLVGQIISTILICIVTVVLSSPFGGMLWYYHDMQAGFFPGNWIGTMIENGIEMGLTVGWLIIGISIPYNILGFITCFFLTRKGAHLFPTNKTRPTGGVQKVHLQ